MSIIESVWDLAGQFMTDPKLVRINEERIRETAEQIKEWLKEDLRQTSLFWGLPRCIKEGDPNKIEKLLLYELIANSVNYCYWYGRSDIRPNEASAVKMYELLDKAFDVAEYNTEIAKVSFGTKKSFFINQVTTQFARNLAIERFPMLEQRIYHLSEITFDTFEWFKSALYKPNYHKDTIEDWIKYMVTTFPGYSNDLFLKRAILFIMQLYRRGVGLFTIDEICELPVPADYQVPKMLRYFGCIEYSDVLAFTVDNNLLMAEGCHSECEIRAATIIACKMIADYANCTCEQVDSYLWLRRNECQDPFHLTITSSY